MQLSQPTLEPHSLCYTCWVRVVYSLLPPLYFFLLFFWGHSTAAQFLPTRESSPGATRSTRTSRRFISQSTSLWCPASERLRLCITLPHTLYQTYVIIVINNIRTCFIISFYVIYAVIYCSFYCIYVWLDPGTYVIARFMFFYKPGVTATYCRTTRLRPGVGWCRSR